MATKTKKVTDKYKPNQFVVHPHHGAAKVVRKVNKNVEISNIDKIVLSDNEFLFHAGTKKIEDKIFSNGGRVLNFVSISDS